jgi:hypothetical protein
LIDKLSFLKGGLRRGRRECGRGAAHAALPKSRGPQEGLCRSARTNFICCATASSSRRARPFACRSSSMRSASCSPTRDRIRALGVFPAARLWKTCHQQLSQFATDLTRQQEARETARHKAECEARENERLADVEQAAQAAAADADLKRGNWNAAQSELAPTDGVLALLQAPPAAEVARGAQQRCCRPRRSWRPACGTQRDRINEALPPFPGISLAARRNINLAIIGYAESSAKTSTPSDSRRAPRKRWRVACTR